MPENVIATSSTNPTSFFNNENNVILSKTNDIMKQSTTPLRNRKPLQSLVNTPSSHAILPSEKASCIDSSEMDLKRGFSSSAIKSLPAVSCITLEVQQQTHNVDSRTQILLNEQNRFFNAPNMTLNTSIEVPSSEESFDQGLVMSDNTVFRDLHFAPEENSTPYLSCGFSNPSKESFEEEDDMLQLRLANPICEESYESSSDHL